MILASAGCAMDDPVTDLVVRGDTAFVRGELKPRIAFQIKRLPRTVNVLVLDSEGGWFGLGAAVEIHRRGLTTVAETKCWHECALLFQAGKRRVLGYEAALVYHLPRLERSPGGGYDELIEAADGNRDEALDILGALYQGYGLQPDFIRRASLAPIELRGNLAIEFGAATELQGIGQGKTR